MPESLLLDLHDYQQLVFFFSSYFNAVNDDDPCWSSMEPDQ